MYLTFFGLNEKPFAITPDPRYLYLSERRAGRAPAVQHQRGRRLRAADRGGRHRQTTIVRSLLAQTPKNTEIALIPEPQDGAGFLLTICEELGIRRAGFGTGEPQGPGRHPQSLPAARARAGASCWWWMRRRTRRARAGAPAPSKTNTQKLQIILIGQPELRDLLGRNELRQLAQRVTGRYHLNPLSRDETTAYVRHRLRVAGATTDIFSPQALSEVFRLSQGVPRVINVICDRALLGAYSLDRHRVTAALVRHAAAEVFGRRFTPHWLPWALTAGVAALLTGGLVALWNFEPWNHRAVAHSALSSPGDAAAAVPAEKVPAPAAAATAAAAAPAPSHLTELLAQHKAETDTDSAFAKLFSLWGAKYQPSTTDPCTQAAQQGLECVSERGSFGQLRLYNHPAILLLNDGGASHQVVLTSLGEDEARLQRGGTHKVGIGEL
jgi:general secretion pathway protein A